MSRPSLDTYKPAIQAQIVAQLHAAPRPKTVHIEDVAECVKAKKREERKRKSAREQAQFCMMMLRHDLPAPEVEYRFAPDRKWRCDYAWPDCKVALEVEGGVWTGGRHTRGSGFVKDMEKYNRAALMGWRVVKCVPSDLMKPATVAMLRGMLAKGENE